MHPRTGLASRYESRVTMTEGSVTREIDIKMNEPLRHDGLTFYQYQMNRAANFTVFQVVENPGVLLPYISCFLVTFGLMWVFTFSLVRFSERKAA